MLRLKGIKSLHWYYQHSYPLRVVHCWIDVRYKYDDGVVKEKVNKVTKNK